MLKRKRTFVEINISDQVSDETRGRVFRKINENSAFMFIDIFVCNSVFARTETKTRNRHSVAQSLRVALTTLPVSRFHQIKQARRSRYSSLNYRFCWFVTDISGMILLKLIYCKHTACGRTGDTGSHPYTGVQYVISSGDEQGNDIFACPVLS